MKHNLLINFFSTIILVSFINLSLSPFVCAMGDREGEDRPLLTHRSSPSPSNSLEENGSEEAGVFPHNSDVQNFENDSLAPFLAYSKKLKEDALDEKSLFEALSALEIDLGSKPSHLQKYGLPISAVIIATGSAAALAEMYMFDSGVGVLLGLPTHEIFSEFPPTQAIIAGMFAGSLVLVGAPFQMTECLTHMTNGSSKYKAKAEPQKSIKKKIFLGSLIWGTCGILSVKGIFAFVETNINQGVGSTVFSAVAGPFFGVYKLVSAHDVATEKWTLIYQWCEEKIYKFRGRTRIGEEERDLLRTRFANSFRKIILDKASDGKDTEKLFDEVHTLHKAGKQQLSLWDQEIKALQKQLSQAFTKEHQESLQSSIEELKKSRDAFQRVLTLATLKSLYDFDKEDASFPEHLRDPKWHGSHPWWYRAAQGGGVVLGGLSAYAIGWSWKYVFNTLVGTYLENHPEEDDDGYTPYILPNGASDTVATALTLFYAPYLTSSAISMLENLAGSVMQYNPIENDRYIKKPNLTYYRARGVASFLNWCSHTFQEIPAALVGGTAMWWAGIPLSQQWWTLAPYMAVMGAAGDVLSGEVLQKNMTKLMNRFERSDGGIEHKRQFIADLLKVSDDWLKTLRGPYVVDLKDLLDKDFDELFKVDKKEDGRPDGEGIFVGGETGDSDVDPSISPQRNSASKDMPLTPRTLQKKARQNGTQDGVLEKSSPDDSGILEEDDMRRPGQKDGLTAPLLERFDQETRTSPPSGGVKGWFIKHLQEPFQKWKKGSDTSSNFSSGSEFEMGEVQEA